MPDDTTVALDPDAVLADGLLLVDAACQSGDWKPMADWLAGHPAHAAEVLQFIDDQGKMARRLPPADSNRFGKYERRELIGRGGMADVYRAFDPVLNQPRALKVLRADGGFTAVDVARFRYEAQVVASLTHPNVVTVHDYGEAASGPYLVMPLLTAGSLADWLKKQPDHRTDPTTAAELVRDIARGVHHAHEQGLIHRDLKPGNVLMDDSGTPKVADFGLARRTDAPATTGIAGTPAYMAPEQARGEKLLTPAVDLHALGAILFELLTGRPPFGGGDIASVLRRIDEEPPPAVRQFRAGVPADLEAICAKCLEKRPGDRYATAQELADDLRRYLDGEPLEHARRGWLTDLNRALGWRRQMPSMGSWWAPFCGAVSTALALGWIQAAGLLAAPEWVGWAGMAYYLVAWLVIVRLFQTGSGWVRNPVERGSAAVQYGMALASAAVVPAQLALTGGSIEACFQPFCAIVGVGIFAHGIFYWGGLYAAGLFFLAFAALMPLIPTRLWPGTYGAFNVAFQVWTGFHLLRVHRDAVAATAPPKL